MALIEQRHPALAKLMALWQLAQQGVTPPCASRLVPEVLSEKLTGVTVMLEGEEELRITASGMSVDALYGEHLVGTPAARLTPERDDAEREARAAIATRRPLLIEDELRSVAGRHRVARLYLPLANDDGSPNGVLCGVVPLT